MRIRNFFELLKEALLGLKLSEVRVHAAALAFYTFLSLTPLITITLAIAGLVFSRATAADAMVKTTATFLGKPAAALAQDMVGSGAHTTTGGLLALVSFALLLFAASNVFWQLRFSLHTMWGLVPNAETRKGSYRAIFFDRLVSITAVFVAGISLVGLMIFNAAVAAIMSKPVQDLLVGFEWVTWLLSLVVAPALYFAIFAAIFKFLPNIRVSWREIWPGTLLTSLLSWVGGALVWLYLSRSAIASAYGAAGSIVVLLIWAMASAFIFLFGAKFIQTYVNKYATPIAARVRAGR